MDSIGRLASDLPAAFVADDTFTLIVVAAIAAAMIYLLATYAITRARDRDDRRSSNDQGR